MTLLHHADAKTAAGKLKRLVFRHDAAPRHPNFVRRFREELRLTRDDFADLMGVPVGTLRSWEREKDAVVPGGGRLTRLIELANRNEYPLYIRDIQSLAKKSRQ